MCGWYTENSIHEKVLETNMFERKEILKYSALNYRQPELRMLVDTTTPYQTEAVAH